MTQARSEALTHLQSRRSAMLQRFLWILLPVALASIPINALLLGPSGLTLSASLPNLTFAIIIVLALWLNHHDRFITSIRLVIGIVLAATTIPLFLVGIGNNAIGLFLLFLPITLAGLTLNRRDLYLTTTISLVLVLTAAVIQQTGTTPIGAPTSSGLWIIVLQIALALTLLALFLEHFGLTLREALEAASQHEEELKTEVEERRKAEERAKSEKSFARAIIASLPGLFYVIDQDGRYVDWNDNLERVSGYASNDLVTLTPTTLVPEAKPLDYTFDRIIGEGAANLEATLVSKDGAKHPYLFRAAHFTTDDGSFIVGIGIDQSNMHAAKRRIERLNAELQDRLERVLALREIDAAITSNLSLDHTLDVALAQVSERLGVKAASVLLYNPHDQTLRYATGRGFISDGLRNVRLRIGEGLAGKTALSRQPVFITNGADFEHRFVRHDAVSQDGFAFYAAVPLIAKGQLRGVLEVFHDAPRVVDDDWRGFLDILATQTAIALHNSMMLEQLEQSNHDLRLAYDTTIEGWAKALDLRDEETEGHSRRVTSMAVELAEHLGVHGNDLTRIRRGALLHDIGKMGIPDSILLKPGKLTSDEWERMKEHTTYAADMLSGIPFLRDALDIPYAHHEKWDGSGYPRGLRGTHIPEAARIFAVVDVYDALTNDRPYRKAWSRARALDHIRQNAGTHFDPRIADAFLDLYASEPNARQGT